MNLCDIGWKFREKGKIINLNCKRPRGWDRSTKIKANQGSTEIRNQSQNIVLTAVLKRKQSKSYDHHFLKDIPDSSKRILKPKVEGETESRGSKSWASFEIVDCANWWVRQGFWAPRSLLISHCDVSWIWCWNFMILWHYLIPANLSRLEWHLRALARGVILNAFLFDCQ